MEKDYYAILEVSPAATPEEVRRAYRRLALERHPDRNGGSRAAEDSFKGLTEAYAVLGDPGRRAAYDRARREAPGRAHTRPDPGDLFDQLFRHPVLGEVFNQLGRDFARQGLRFDEAYLRRVFTGRRGGVLFGGFVFVWPFGPLSTPPFGRPAAPEVERGREARSLPRPPGLLQRILRAALPRPRASRHPGEGMDVRYSLPVAPQVLRQGGRVRIAVPAGTAGRETYDVRIPAGSLPGARLRLRGRGAGSGEARGDLYLELRPAE